MSVCLVRGSGDIASAVAHALFTAGYGVVVHDVPAPTCPRRGRAFVDALFDGHSRLEGVEARLAGDLASLARIVDGGELIGITAVDFEAVLGALRPVVLVDARMRKRQVPEGQRGLAPLTIGLGPNFVAGETTDLVVETAWGACLGEVIFRGPPLPFTGEPRAIAGHARERYAYAPVAGRFETAGALGAPVLRGHELARIGEIVVRAPLDGVVVGLTRSGVAVPVGAKILEVDPRPDPALAYGIGERAGTIARGVLSIVAAKHRRHREAHWLERIRRVSHSGARA